MDIIWRVSQEKIYSDLWKWNMYSVVEEPMWGPHSLCIWLHSDIWVAKQITRHDFKTIRSLLFVLFHSFFKLNPLHYFLISAKCCYSLVSFYISLHWVECAYWSACVLCGFFYVVYSWYETLKVIVKEQSCFFQVVLRGTENIQIQ